jgi:XRE family transcriptional regulator, regulator of sulfur utilization
VARVSRTRHHRETSQFLRAVRVLGQAIRSLRRERGWTVEEAAGRFGVEPAFVRRIESGRTNPSLAVIISIATALGAGPSELLQEPEG